MTTEAIRALCSSQFFKNFAEINSAYVVDNDGVEALFTLIEESAASPSGKANRESTGFRASYILEYIYFKYPLVFAPYEDRFVALFPLITDEGAKRHFGKMMANWLTSHQLDKVITEQIAEAAASWIIEPKVRVAVQIWAMEVLLSLRNQVEWIPDTIHNLMETLTVHATPAINVRLKEWNKRIR